MTEIGLGEAIGYLLLILLYSRADPGYKEIVIQFPTVITAKVILKKIV